MNRCVHAIDGRIRIKVPMIKDVPFRALELEDALNAIDGVTFLQSQSSHHKRGYSL